MSLGIIEFVGSEVVVGYMALEIPLLIVQIIAIVTIVVVAVIVGLLNSTHNCTAFLSIFVSELKTVHTEEIEFPAVVRLQPLILLRREFCPPTLGTKSIPVAPSLSL